MRIRDERGQDEPHIDLVPLIDVILVLIIFFVVTTTFDARSTLQLQLPNASDQHTPVLPRTLSVLINADGHYFVNDQEVLRTDVESVKRSIAQIAGDDRMQPVLLRADARTPYQAVVTVQDALGQLGFRRIAIATAPDVNRDGSSK
ncbi:ExbD/TolR family protein [Xanthomonas albilineans]|uniref:ExbD/TolR family protein n=1 Tax=Xanthomonas albilineans TaxID=29447 RepID=UPI0005F359D4|nr:biopolymer transporter ExbD [Xanthomonas albilineans]PPU94567.1 biopolymer transporter ExbD [Xanthomonas albilineans]